MKLLQRFREEISRMNTIKRAWFTSFNLNPSFAERYILPALFGWDEVPRTTRDFEVIMQHIHERGMDVRFFCDARVLELDEGKKTTVNIHPLNISRFDSRFKDGVFHPKVILLQDEKGQSTLFCGSANVTIAGWAHNRECVDIQIIRSRNNANRVTQFFRKIFDAVYGEKFPGDFSILAEEADESWRFSSTLTDEIPFLRMLLSPGVQDLAIWSPYFTADMPKFFDDHLQGQSVYVIPDVQGEKVRIRNDAANIAAFRNPNVWLKEYQYADQNQKDRMTHAKIWLTMKNIAVGSWNMTQAGIGGNPGGNNNIEAGIICEAGTEHLSEVLKKCKPLDCDFMNAEELAEEAPELAIGLFRYNVSVVLDWHKRKYFIEMNEPPDNEAFVLKLPDQELKYPLPDEHPVNEDNIDSLLQNHMYSLESNGKTIQVGFIKEKNCIMRPVWKYGNLTELLFAYITQSNTNSGSENHQIGYKISSGEPGDQADVFLSTGETPGGISYFGMFQAFAGIRERIDKAMAAFEKDPVELFRLAHVYPGSICEIAEKIEKVCAEDVNKNIMSPVYKWYLVQECNSIIAKVKHFSEKRTGDTMLGELAKELSGKILYCQELNVPEEAKAYLCKIYERCGYSE